MIPGHFVNCILGSHARFFSEPVQNNLPSSAFVKFDQSLTPVKRLKKAQWIGSQGNHGPNDPRPFRSIRPRFACEQRAKPASNTIQFKALYQTLL